MNKVHGSTYPKFLVMSGGEDGQSHRYLSYRYRFVTYSRHLSHDPRKLRLSCGGTVHDWVRSRFEIKIKTSLGDGVFTWPSLSSVCVTWTTNCLLLVTFCNGLA